MISAFTVFWIDSELGIIIPKAIYIKANAKLITLPFFSKFCHNATIPAATPLTIMIGSAIVDFDIKTTLIIIQYTRLCTIFFFASNCSKTTPNKRHPNNFTNDAPKNIPVFKWNPSLSTNIPVSDKKM